VVLEIEHLLCGNRSHFAGKKNERILKKGGRTGQSCRSDLLNQGKTFRGLFINITMPPEGATVGRGGKKRYFNLLEKKKGANCTDPR